MTALLEVRDLRITYPTRRGPVHAVDGVSFAVPAGRTVALVGESGCGKSTVALALLQLIAVDGGQVRFDGADIATLGRAARRRLRREFAIVFQNPYSSLDPKMRVRDIVAEPLDAALDLARSATRERVADLLVAVGLGPEHMGRFPHEFSGGQRQRIAIARALALEPRLLVLDEPTAALDVSVQAQVLNLLGDLQRRLGLSYLFISHNLATVDYLADDVLVMYLGRIVEAGSVADVFRDPRHPYSRALLDSIPSLDPAQRDLLRAVRGDVPSPLQRPPGCAFAPRCPTADATCRGASPALADLAAPGDEGRRAACYHPLEPGAGP